MITSKMFQNVYAPEEDPEMTIDHYDRSWNQNEELGLNDMKVEGYEATATSGEAAKNREDTKATSAEAQHLVE
jgi:zinc finger protein